MPASYEDDEQPSRLTHVIYNLTLGHVRVRSEDGPATTVEVPPGEVRFRRVLGAVEPETAVWLDSAEQNYLGRMLEHVLSTLKITPEARAALESVRAKLAELAPPATDATDGATPPLSLEAAAAEPPAEVETPALAEPAEPAAAVAPPLAATEAVPEPTPAAAASRAPAPAAAPAAPARRSAQGAPAPAPAADAAGGAGRERGTVARPAARGRPEHSAAALGRRAAVARESAAGARASAPDERPEPAAAAPAPPAAPSGPPSNVRHPVPFDVVWADLQALSARRTPLHRLTGQTSSEIRDIDAEGVWLYSNSTGRTYQIARSFLAEAWGALASSGQLVPRDVRMGFGAVTLLAHLPYVDYSIDPVTLYYPSVAPHPLGTVHRREA